MNNKTRLGDALCGLWDFFSLFNLRSFSCGCIDLWFLLINAVLRVVKNKKRLKTSWMGIYQRKWQLTDASRSDGLIQRVMRSESWPGGNFSFSLHSDRVTVKRDEWIINLVIQSDMENKSHLQSATAIRRRHCFVSLEARNKQPSESLPDTLDKKGEISYRGLLSAWR